VTKGSIVSSIALLSVVALTLGGCASPRIVMTSEGQPTTDRMGNSLVDAEHKFKGSFEVLHAAYEKAYTRQLAVAKDPSKAKPEDAVLYQGLALHGMTAVYGNCSDFFLDAGEHEKYIGFTRDAVAVAGSLAAGIMALSSASSSAVATVALTTGTLYSSLDVYTKNFLFGAENIDSVRALIMNVLDVHQKAVLEDTAPWTFDNAVKVILDHQDLCRPSAIVNYVRAAIKNGHLDASKPSAETESAIAAQDQLVKLMVARDVGFDQGTVDDLDLFALLYWQYADTPTADEIPFIRTTLVDKLPDGKGPFIRDPAAKDIKDNPKWTTDDRTKLIVDLHRFSRPATDALTQRIETLKKSVKPATAPPAAGAPAAPPATPVAPYRLPPSPSAAGAKHYTITVR
jgi:hypothetical protein